MIHTTQTFVALLRGINVGGHHKVPMKELVLTMNNLGCTNVKTLLNTGNIIFDFIDKSEKQLEILIQNHLENTFEFPIPVMVRSKKDIAQLQVIEPFKLIANTKDSRLYVSFLKKEPELKIDFSKLNNDPSFQILNISNKMIFSVLDLSVNKTSKGMDILEKQFGKEITTRNWNTILKIIDKL